MDIAFIDLKKQFSALETDIRQAMDKVLAHAQFIMGPEVGQLEKALAEFTGVKHAIGCASGTDALLLPLMAYGVKPGDAVFTTTFSFIASAEVISLLGATPVFVDIDPRTFNIDPAKLRQTVEKVMADGRLRAKGIIAVDLFGLPADYDPIMALAQEKGLFVIEDAAQSFGSKYKGRPAGSLGHVGATSFFPAKPLGCYGDGGAVFTNDDDLAEKMRSIRVHGQGRHKYENIRIGVNARLDTLQAAILLAKLPALPREISARQRVATRYDLGLIDHHLDTPQTPGGYSSAWAQYSVLTEQPQQRDPVVAALKATGIPIAIYYPIPLHLQAAFANLGYQLGDFPAAEDISRRIFSLPMHPYMEDRELEYIISRVIRVVAGG